MRLALGYFLGALLFAVATALNLVNEGLNLKTGVGLIFFIFLLVLGARARPGSTGN